ncbi:MAG: sigma-70 family RNA polymerase sigma factor, partial [Verrucomicrobiota bacterium]
MPDRIGLHCSGTEGLDDRIESLRKDQGDSEALEIYQAHRATLINYARRFVGDASRAEDVVQEAWLRFDRAMNKQAPVDPAGFLYRVVRNLAIDSGRKSQREERVISFGGAESDSVLESNAPSIERSLQAREDLQRLWEALDELPERTREAIKMRRLEGLKLKEIAARMDVSAPFVHQIIAAGLAHCRRKMRND